MTKRINTGLSVVVATVCLFFALPGYASNHAYPSDAKVAIQIGSDLYDSLDAKYRNQLDAHPIRFVSSEDPMVLLVKTNDQNRVVCQISVSVGFVDLINHIAHAKAIDRVEHGYFSKYMAALEGKGAAPAIVEDRYWTDKIINEQSGYFGQIMGWTMAINLSHYYLGQFEKHAGQLQTGAAIPINNLLSPSEWDKGVRAGAVNSLNCALGSDGAKALFDAIGKMTQRPAWADYIVPQKTNFARLDAQMATYESDFFHGRLN
jgi:hypothetical protein